MGPETIPSAASPEALPRLALAREIEAATAARASDPSFPSSRVSRIRAAAARMAASEFRPDDLRSAALFLERQATIDLQVPTASRVPGVALLKRIVKKVMIWYLRFVGHQISAFGQATARFGVSVANRVDGLEAEIADLQQRVAQLEAGLPSRPGDDPPHA